jgi:lysophospholipase L1-like esterase
MFKRLFLLVLTILVAGLNMARADVLTTDNVQITWKVVNRFRFFRDEALFNSQEQAWRQYGQHVNNRDGGSQANEMFYYNSSVLGTEHVLNDRRIPFSNILRTKFDWQGWAAQASENTCYDRKARNHSACGGVDAYIKPQGHEIEIGLKMLNGGKLVSEYTCHWHVGNNPDQPAPCDETIRATIPYPDATTISVNVEGERRISIEAQVKDVMIVGLGDSFASGEGNPDTPVRLDEFHRSQNLYPTRKRIDAGGAAQWLDKLCHRSMYSYQMRAALQIGIENKHSAVTYLGYACSGAAVEKGIIGPQTYVEVVSGDLNSGSTRSQPNSGSKRDAQMARFLKEMCKVEPVQENGLWACPGQQFKRKVDFVFVSIGGNDIGFANLVSWATLRAGPLTKLAGWLGVTVSPAQFAANMTSVLPSAYQRLARQLEKAMPLADDSLTYDPSHVILTAYPDILVDEKGETCQGIKDESQIEDIFAANQSLDRFSTWLVVRQDKLDAAHAQLDILHRRMGEVAEANGWTYAGRAYADRPFKGHGFCARRNDRLDDPAEALMIPCWGKASRPTQSCQSGIFGQGTGWRPLNPAKQNYPYALRQRWVRTINDAYMMVNQKVVDRFGEVDAAASERAFAETVGAMHPSAEGHASMADAMLIDLRKEVTKVLATP